MILDLILTAIITVCAYLGYKRGFVKSLCNMCSLLVSLLVSFLTYNKITTFIAESAVGKFITDFVSESLGGSVEANTPEFWQNVFGREIEGTVESITENLSGMIIGIISIIITIIVVKLIIKLLFKILNLFAKLPVVKQCNKLMGTVFGILCGIFWICIVSYAVYYISAVPGANVFRSIIQGSKIVEFIFDNGFMLGLFS